MRLRLEAAVLSREKRLRRRKRSEPVLLTESLAGVNRGQLHRVGRLPIGRLAFATRTRQNRRPPFRSPPRIWEGMASALEREREEISTDTAFQTLSSRLLAIHPKARVLGGVLYPSPSPPPPSIRFLATFPPFSSSFENRSTFLLSEFYRGWEGGEGEVGSRRGWNLIVVVVVVVIFSLAFLGIFSRRIRTGLEEEVKSLANRYYLGTRRQPLDDPAGSAMENSYVERHESGGPGRRRSKILVPRWARACCARP